MDQSELNALAGGLPVEPPREERRVFHPSGFSIVRPANWESKVGVGGDSGMADGIELASPNRRKPQAVVLVVKYASKPAIRGRVLESQFQGCPALMTIERRPAMFLDYPGHLRVQIAFERGGAWFEIRYSLFEDAPVIPSLMWDYLNSFSTNPPIRADGERQ